MVVTAKAAAIQLVLIRARVHPFPSRTRKLSSLLPTILGWRRPGKIGGCRIYKRVLLLSMIRSKNKHSWMAWSIRPEVSKIQDIVSETRMYLENFIQELRQNSFSEMEMSQDIKEIQISSLITRQENERNTKPADVTLYISEETENQEIRSFLLRLKQ